MRSIVKNDTVKVISGNYKGKSGKVIKVLVEKNRVIVEKIRMVKRHTKQRSAQIPGGIIEKEASVRQADPDQDGEALQRQEGSRVRRVRRNDYG